MSMASWWIFRKRALDVAGWQTDGVLLASHDHEIMQTTANRIIEILPQGCLDRQGTYEEFIDFKKANGLM